MLHDRRRSLNLFGEVYWRWRPSAADAGRTVRGAAVERRPNAARVCEHFPQAPMNTLGVFGYGHGNILAPVRRSEATYCSPAGYQGRGQTNGGPNGVVRDRDEIASTHTCQQDARMHVSTTEQRVGFQGYRQSLDLEVVGERGRGTSDLAALPTQTDQHPQIQMPTNHTTENTHPTERINSSPNFEY